MTINSVRGNLWDYWDQGWKVVVTTNIGWDPKNENRNNMGAGMALQACCRWPWLASWYGEHCMRFGANTPVIELDRLRLIFLPVKPLLPLNPAMSWNQTAKLSLIARGLPQLAQHDGNIAMAWPGCGNGWLDPEELRPAMDDFFDIRATVQRARGRTGATLLVDRR